MIESTMMKLSLIFIEMLQKYLMLVMMLLKYINLNFIIKILYLTLKQKFLTIFNLDTY